MTSFGHMRKHGFETLQPLLHCLTQKHFYPLLKYELLSITPYDLTLHTSLFQCNKFTLCPIQFTVQSSCDPAYHACASRIK